MNDLVQTARALAAASRQQLEWQLLELDGQMEALKRETKPVRSELERLAKKKLEIMRRLGMR